MSSNANQITMKYILIPGINSNVEDYISLIDIMKKLDVRHLTISRDLHVTYDMESDYRDNLLRETAAFMTICRKNEISTDLFSYTPQEREEIDKIAAAMRD